MEFTLLVVSMTLPRIFSPIGLRKKKLSHLKLLGVMGKNYVELTILQKPDETINYTQFLTVYIASLRPPVD